MTELLKSLLAAQREKQVVEARRGGDLDGAIDNWLERNNIHHFEGSRGISNFEKLTRAIGYRSLDEFFEDNPGAVTGLVEWIKEQYNPEWESNLRDDADEN